VQECYELGANTYITKPVDFEKFVHAVQILDEYWMVIAKLPARPAKGTVMVGEEPLDTYLTRARRGG